MEIHKKKLTTGISGSENTDLQQNELKNMVKKETKGQFCTQKIAYIAEK